MARVRVSVSGINGSRVVGGRFGGRGGKEVVVEGPGWGRLVQQANQSLKPNAYSRVFGGRRGRGDAVEWSCRGQPGVGLAQIVSLLKCFWEKKGYLK